MTPSPPRGVVTIMFTDIVGSTELRDRLVLEFGEAQGDARYRRLVLDPHNTRIRGVLSHHGGFEVKTNGDSFMASFPTPADAIQCAVEIQRSFAADPLTTSKGALSVRIGMHTGQPTAHTTPSGWDYDGAAVNIAARIEGLLRGGGQILCSATTAEVAGHLPGIRCHRCGDYLLKGIAEAIAVVEVLWRDDQEPYAPPQSHRQLAYPWQVPWVGRRAEVDELRAALRANRQVTLLGPGGVGKTRLAIETLLAHAGDLPHEVVVVALAASRDDPEAFLTAVREAIGLTELEAPDVTALCRRLSGNDRLLLLDNFETVMSAAKMAQQLAAVAGLRTLVTSQRAVGYIGEKVVVLEPMATRGSLDELDSFRLFVEVATRRDPKWKPDDRAAMRRILELTDGLPYVIEFVAARAPFATLSDVAEGLLLEAGGGGGDDVARPDRHRSVEACWTWSVAHLDQKARSALARVAVFVGTFDIRAAKEVAKVGANDVTALIDASFLRFDRETGRYSLLPTTRELAVRSLGARARARLERAHAAYYVALLENADRDLRTPGGELQKAARRAIECELANIRATVAWADDRDVELFRRSVFALSIFLAERCAFSEQLALAATLAEQTDADKSPADWAMAQSNLGIAYADLATGNRSDNLLRAIDCYQAAQTVLTENNFPSLWARTQNNLGNAYAELPTGEREENLRRAIACYQAAQRVQTEHDYPVHWAKAQNNLGMVYTNLPTGDRGENLQRAIGCYQAAQRVWTERDFPADWAMLLSNLGSAYAALPTGDRGENLERAVDCYLAALRVRTERDLPAGWARTQNNLGSAYAELPAGDRAENLRLAIGCYLAALRVRTERDFPASWARTQNNLGNAYAELPTGDRVESLRQAISCYEAALRVRTERDLPAEWAITQNDLATACEELLAIERGGHLGRAVACYQAAARGFEAVGLRQRATTARQRAVELAARQ